MASGLGRALRHRNYRLFFTGQGISLIGTWLTRFATLWLVYKLTDSGTKLGLVAFFSQAPTSVLAPLAGVLVDRWDRHRVIVVTQILALLQSAALALFAFTHWMTVWDLMILGSIQAVINAFDMPARQSFLGQMIEDRADLPNAIALNSTMVNGARILGPMIAAALIAWFGAGWCFTIDAASYVAVIASLLLMRLPKRAPRPRHGRVWQEMRDGLRYVRSEPLVRAVLLLLAVTSVLGGAYSQLLPLIAGDELHGGPDTLGILMGAAGVGALLGALYLASRTTVVGLAGVIARCSIGLGAGMIAMSFTTATWNAIPAAFAIGVSLMVQMAATNTIVQTIVSEDKLGRVMSLYAVAFFAGAPVGALIEGNLADWIGPMHTFLAAGVATLACALWFARTLPRLREVTRPLYVRLGLIREPAPAVDDS